MKLEFAENVRKLRKQKNLTQSQLAKRLGVNKSIISSYENQERMPSISILLKLSNEFNVSIEYLLGVNRHYSLDVSELTDEQAVIVNNLVEEFTKNNMNNKNTNSLPAKIRFF